MLKAKKAILDSRIPLLALVIFVAMSLTNEYFFKPVNMTGLFESISAYGIVAVGFTFVLLCGQLDISMGSVMALGSSAFAGPMVVDRCRSLKAHRRQDHALGSAAGILPSPGSGAARYNARPAADRAFRNVLQ